MSKQRAPRSIHESSGVGSAGPQSGDHDADVERAGQQGNGAMQEEMQGGASESGGGWDLAGELLGDVLDWTWDQITTAEAFAAYLEAVGEAAGREMAEVLADRAPDVVEGYLGFLTDVSDFAFFLADLLGELSVLPSLNPTVQAAWLVGAVLRDAVVVLRAFMALDLQTLLQVAREAGPATIDALLNRKSELALRLLDAAWTPGVGVALSAGGDAALVFGAAYHQTATLRHQGQGAFDAVSLVEVEANMEPGLGGQGGDKKADVGWSLSGEGSVEVGYSFPDLWTLGRVLLARVVASEWQTVGQLMDMAGVDLGRKQIDSVKVGAGVSLEAEAEGKADEFGAALAGALAAGLETEATDMEWAGDLVSRASVTCRGEASAMIDFLGNFPEAQGLELPAFSEDAGAAGFVEVTMDFDLASKSLFSNFALEIGGGLDLGYAEVETGVGVDLGAIDSAQEALDRLSHLRIKAMVDADARAARMVERTPLFAWFGTDVVQGTLTVESTLDRDTAQFFGKLVLDTLTRAQGDEAGAKRFLDWLANPLALLPPELRGNLAMELASAVNLTAVLAADLTFSSEYGLSVKDGAKLGLTVEGEVTIDYERDILGIGGSVSMSDMQQLIEQTTSELAAA
jgi:hypothetical protein